MSSDNIIANFAQGVEQDPGLLTDTEEADGEELEKDEEEEEIEMFTMLLECPMTELKTHKYYNPEFVMTIIIGQSGNLKHVMDDNLEQEISRGLLIFFLSLLGGSLLLFVVFSAVFERRLQIRVTKPISQLSKQIRNPKEFVTERNSAVDFPHGRKGSHRRNNSDAARSTTMSRPSEA